MPVLTAANIGQSFGAFDVFAGVSASIPNGGRIGLVGPNGVGKTTLLRIIAGLEQPASGSLQIARGVRLGYLSQEAAAAFSGRTATVYEEMLEVFSGFRAMGERLRQMEIAMTVEQPEASLLEAYSKLQDEFELAGGYEFEQQIKRVLSGLGFGRESWEQPLDQLSGGQKTRALLARLLLESPDLLVLDEPTNHLDVEAIEWLEGTLRTWNGAVLMVSHDRYFLDRVVNNIWEMSPTGVEVFRGNYSAYLTQRTERWELKNKQFEAFRERLDKEMDFIRRNMAGQRTQMAQGKLSRLAREVEAVHAGGLEILPALKSRGWLQVQSDVGLAMRPAGTIAELQQRIDDLRGPARPLTFDIPMRTAFRSGNIVLRSSDLQAGYPGLPLFQAGNIELHRQECAGLIGPNGVGKTTFLRTILEEIPPLAGKVELGASLKIGYFAQTRDSLRPENSVLDEFLRHQPMPLSEARNFLGRYLFRGDDVYNKVETLSGGEQARLALAILSLQEANFLLLDEPTNHLDIPAQEALQQALEQFGGTILLVTHDRFLIDRLATQIWELRDGRLLVFSGSYQEYLQERDNETLSSPGQGTAAVESNGSTSPRKAGLSKNAERLRAERLQVLEDRIHDAELHLAALADALQAASQEEDIARVRSLSAEYGGLEAELAELMDSWELMHRAVHS